MWGVSSNYPNISNYEEAKRIYETTKSLRSRPDFRPLDARSSSAKSQIIKDGDEYIIQLYHTDIVTYFPDGSIFITTGGWSTLSMRAAISAMSPFSAWSSKGDTAVAVRLGAYVAGETKRFILPRGGLLFRPENGALVPVNPPVAVLRKTRVKKEEAKAARKFFEPVEVYIKAYSAAFKGGEVGYVRSHGSFREVFASGVLSAEQASEIAWAFLTYGYNWSTQKRLYTGDAKAGCAAFWKRVYEALALVEDYEVPLPYGTVA